MRIPRLLQAFIPFGILDDVLDTSRSKTERLVSATLLGIFALALIGTVLSSFSGGIAFADIIKLAVLALYACIMIYVLVVGGQSIFRMGKAAQGLSKKGYYTLGVLCILCGILLVVAIPYALYAQYLQ